LLGKFHHGGSDEWEVYKQTWPGNVTGRDCMGQAGRNGWVISKVILKMLNAGLNVGAGLNRHGMSLVIGFMNCEPKLRGREFLSRLINYSRKTLQHEVRYF
jgi:hypothetical protein